MIFDVMLLLKEKSTSGKERRNAYRVHDRDLSRFVRDAQDRGDYIEQVHPLFRQKREVNSVMIHKIPGTELVFEYQYPKGIGLTEKDLLPVEVVDSIDPNSMIDPHGF